LVARILPISEVKTRLPELVTGVEKREEEIIVTTLDEFVAETAETGLIGHTLGDFEILQRIGTGGMGTVYQAHDPQLDREVALKVPRAGQLEDLSEIDRFLREARAAA
jgi:serine/threonine protein kinase